MADQDVSWEPLPSYLQLASCIYNFTIFSVGDLLHPKDSSLTQKQSSQYFNFSSDDTLLVMFLAFALTVMRILMTEWYFKPLGRALGLTPANCRKMPESACKFLYYLCAWLYAFYVVVLSGRYRFFQNPGTVWAGWEINMQVPEDIYWMYAVQCGFYVHALYATVFLDTWRKDSVVMLIHHFVTLALVSISYSLRYHNIGALTFLLHDICDIQLEFTKLNVYLKTQGGKNILRHEVLASVTSFCFGITWFISRLYYYPLKLLYSSTCEVTRLQLDLPCAALMNILLSILQVMHIYWFMFIVKFMIRVASGDAKGAEDTREYDEDDFVKQLSERHTEDNHVQLNGNLKSNGAAEAPIKNGNDHGVNLRDRRKGLH